MKKYKISMNTWNGSKWVYSFCYAYPPTKRRKTDKPELFRYRYSKQGDIERW